MERHGVTGLAGVPHTFDLLDASGFADRELSRLRYVTQAGGKLAPERVTQYLQLGQRRGWDFLVMYGQTEATARMAYLPTDLAERHPSAIGIAIPGGRSAARAGRRRDRPDDRRARLHRAQRDDGLRQRTGRPGPRAPSSPSCARATSGRALPDGLHRGRRAKQPVRQGLRPAPRPRRDRAAPPSRGHAGGMRRGRRRAGGRSSRTGTQVECAPHDRGRAVRRSRSGCARRQRGHPDDAHPARPTTAPWPSSPAPRSQQAPRRGGGASVDELCGLYAGLLGHDVVTPDDCFVGLGADSLSYVELSVRLGERLERLPRDWHLRTIAELASEGRPAITSRDEHRSRA